jgi:hypothetical protein
MYVFGCKLSLFRLCDSDFGITPVDDITIGITCAAFCFQIAHFIRQLSVFFLFFGYYFGELLLLFIFNSVVQFSSHIGGSQFSPGLFVFTKWRIFFYWYADSVLFLFTSVVFLVSSLFTPLNVLHTELRIY